MKIFLSLKSSKKYILEDYQSGILSPRIGLGQLSATCQEVWVCESWGKPVIRGLSGRLVYVQMYLQA